MKATHMGIAEDTEGAWSRDASGHHATGNAVINCNPPKFFSWMHRRSKNAKVKMFMNRISMKLYLTIISIIFLYLFLFSSILSAATFDIKPVRVEFTDKVRLEKLVIKNVSDTDFPVQVHVYEWSQNEKGEDVYGETQDIVVFPKIMTIKKGEERYIRLGANVFPGIKEKTYRVYVEEMPSETKEQQGATVRLFMKVGIPIFITPPNKIEDKAEIESLSMDKGKIQVKVKNSGNSHFIVTGINVRGMNAEGQEAFNRSIGGWYILSGMDKAYETDVPSGACGNISSYDIELKTSKATIKKNLTADKSMCGNVAEIAN
jgi:fimbrial chaperone protein